MSLKNTIRNAFGGRQKGALPPGTKAPDISLKTTYGQQVSLSEALKKGPVLAAFFKVNCPTCQFTFPFLERLHERYSDSRLTLWGISQNEAQDTREFCKEFGIRFPILLDEDGYPASNQYGLTTVPTLFLISPEGQIRETSVGFVKGDLEKIATEAARGTTKAFSPLFEPGEVIPESKPG